MRNDTRNRHMFRALLRHYRSGRGMSQLDLSGAASVSSRHISFLETGRAQPSREMVLRLCAALGLGLRDMNALLQAAGLPRAFPEASAADRFPPAVEAVIARMLAQQEPYPMLVMNPRYDVLKSNDAALRIFLRFTQDADALPTPLNALHLLFHPQGVRAHVQDWETLALSLLVHLQRETLDRPSDERIPELMRELARYPGVPHAWQLPALDQPSTATLDFTLARGAERVRFITTTTVFNTALDVTLSDLRLESYFPADDATETLCRRVAEASR